MTQEAEQAPVRGTDTAPYYESPAQFNSLWVREYAGFYRNGGWKIVRNRQTRYWDVRRGVDGQLPADFNKPLTRKLDDAMRAVNQYEADKFRAAMTKATGQAA